MSAANCADCGRFTNTAYLVPVWGPMPSSGPDREVCIECAGVDQEEVIPGLSELHEWSDSQ